MQSILKGARIFKLQFRIKHHSSFLTKTPKMFGIFYFIFVIIVLSSFAACFHIDNKPLEINTNLARFANITPSIALDGVVSQ